MIAEQQKNTISWIASVVAVFLLLAWYLSISYDYPYYHAWDMDYVTALDTVLIQSGLLPDQNCHPGFGTYLLLFFSEKIAHAFGALSALNLEDIAASLNPLAAMAELTDFVRIHSPFLALGIAGLLAIAIRRMFDMPRWFYLLFLVVLGTQRSLAYHSSMVRSEFYSVFYWAGAVMAMAIAAKATNHIVRRSSLLVTGLLLGLSFLTKIQALFCLAAVPILLLLAVSLSQDSQKQSRPPTTAKGAYWILAVSLFNVVAFLVLGIASYLTPTPRGVPTWAASFGIEPITVLFFLAFLSLFLCQLFLCLTKKISSDIFRLSSFLSIIAAGFILSFTFYFLLYSDSAISLKHILLHFKMSFLREPKLLRNPELSAYLSNLQIYLYRNPFTVIVIIGLNLLLAFGYRFGFIRIRKSQLALCFLAAVIAFGNVAVVTRDNLRDFIWREVLFNFLILFCIAILVSRATRYRLRLTRVGGTLLIVLFLVNCFYARDMSKRVDAEYHQYGWRGDKWFSSIYGGNQRRYAEIMRKKYNPTTAWLASLKAIDHKRIRRTVNFVFNNQDITHRNIGIVFEGFSAWTTDLDYKIVKVPTAMKGDILVDSASVALRKNRPFRKEYVKKYRNFIDRYQKYSTAGQISVLNRHDLNIFLFVHPDDVSNLLTEKIVQTPYKIILRNTKQSIELQGLEIKDYCGIHLDKITKKFFFVIHKI